MPLGLSLTFGTAPATQLFPGTFQGLGDLLAQYFEIAGGETFIPVNFGSTTPDADHRAYPWFKTDAGGVPVGWFSWNGSAWQQLQAPIPHGTTAERPTTTAVLGTLYLDDQIQAVLMYTGSAWVTQSGSPGDIKYCIAADLAQALSRNPGWVDFEQAAGRVLGAVGEGAGLTPRTYFELVGEETHTLVIEETPEHQHATYGTNASRWQADGNAANAGGNLAGQGNNNTSVVPAAGTGGLAHNNMQPTLFVFCLTKTAY